MDNFGETAKNEVPQFFTVESGYRFYSPELGRWLSRDPIEERGGKNLHAFVSNKPLSEIDDLGLCIWTRRLDLPATADKCADVEWLVSSRAVGFNQVLWDHWKGGTGTAMTAAFWHFDLGGIIRNRHLDAAVAQGKIGAAALSVGQSGSTTYGPIIDERHATYVVTPMSYGWRLNVSCDVEYEKYCIQGYPYPAYYPNGCYISVTAKCKFKAHDVVNFWDNGANFYIPGIPVDYEISDRLVRACFPAGRGFALTSDAMEVKTGIFGCGK